MNRLKFLQMLLLAPLAARAAAVKPTASRDLTAYQVDIYTVLSKGAILEVKPPRYLAPVAESYCFTCEDLDYRAVGEAWIVFYRLGADDMMVVKNRVGETGRMSLERLTGYAMDALKQRRKEVKVEVLTQCYT